MKKLPRRFTPYVFALYMALFMGMLMCCTLVWLQTGFEGDYAMRVLRAYAVAMPLAFFCITFVRPVVARLVARTVEH